MNYEKLATALDRLQRAQEHVKMCQRLVDQMIHSSSKIEKVRKARKKWSYYKRAKFAKKVKARWESMSTAERATAIARMQNGRKK